MVVEESGGRVEMGGGVGRVVGDVGVGIGRGGRRGGGGGGRGSVFVEWNRWGYEFVG